MSGAVKVDGVEAQEGQFLLCRQADPSQTVKLVTEEGAALMAAVIFTR